MKTWWDWIQQGLRVAVYFVAGGLFFSGVISEDQAWTFIGLLAGGLNTAWTVKWNVSQVTTQAGLDAAGMSHTEELIAAAKGLTKR